MEGGINLLGMIFFVMLVLFVKCILAVRGESALDMLVCVILLAKADFLMICREDGGVRNFFVFLRIR